MSLNLQQLRDADLMLRRLSWDAEKRLCEIPVDKALFVITATELRDLKQVLKHVQDRIYKLEKGGTDADC